MFDRLLSFFRPHSDLCHPPDEFKQRLFQVMNVRHSINDLQTLDECKTQMMELINEAKRQHYNLDVYNHRGFTFLHQVILRANQHNDDLCVQLLNLLSQQALNTNKAGLDRFKTTPLITASRRGMVHTVNWLLEHGANPFVEDVDSDGNAHHTPLQYVESAIIAHQTQGDPQQKEELIQRLQEIRLQLLQSEERIKNKTIHDLNQFKAI